MQRNYFPTLVFAAYLPAASASQVNEPLLELTLDELLGLEINIASRSTNTVFAAPSSVSVFTRDDLKRMGVRSLEELLNYVPGVQVSRSQSTGVADTPSFRGRRTDQNSAPSVLLLLDGRRLNSPVEGGGFFNKLNNLDWVKQIEIIRGPGSTLYGANAFNGVINVITQTQERQVNLRVGELDTRELSLQLSDELNVFGQTLSASIFAHKVSDAGEDYAPFFNFIGTLKPTDDPQWRETLGINAALNDFYIDGYYSRSQRENFVEGSNQGNGVNRSLVTDHNWRVGYRGFSYDTWQLDLYADFMNTTKELFLQLLPIELAPVVWWTDGSNDEPIGGNYLRWAYYQLGGDGEINVDDDHLLSFGFEVRHEHVERNPFHGNWDGELMESSQGTIIVPGDRITRGFWFRGELADFLPDSHRNIWNLWLQDEWQYSESAKITLGARYDNYEDFGAHFSLRSAFVYAIAPETQFKVIYGDAFRAPTFSETRALIASNFVGNPQVQPEEIQTLDLVLQHKMKNSQVEITWSKSKITQQIQLVPLDEEFQQGVTPFTPQNVSNHDLQSLEVEYAYNPIEHLIIRGNFTHFFDYSEVGLSENLASIALNYSLQQWNINLNGFYQSEVRSRIADGINFMEDIHLDDFWRFNFKLNYSVNDKLDTYVLAENVFDESYRTYDAANDLLQFGLPARGRILSVGLDWSF